MRSIGHDLSWLPVEHLAHKALSVLLHFGGIWSLGRVQQFEKNILLHIFVL